MQRPDLNVLLTLFFAAIAAGCANLRSTSSKTDACGLTRAQWQSYWARAAGAVVNPAAWAKVGSRKPTGVEPTSRSNLFGTTDSPDGQPPTHVEVYVPIGDSVKGSNSVIVEFNHPSGKITKMWAAGVYY